MTLILCIGFGLYFFGDTILSKIPLKFFRTLDLVLVSKTLRTKLLGLSFLRYLTFIVQFFIALLVFGVTFDLQLFLWIALMYGAITAAPSLFFGKIIVRETIACEYTYSGRNSGTCHLISSLLNVAHQSDFTRTLGDPIT